MQQRLAPGTCRMLRPFVVQDEAIRVVVHDDKVVAQRRSLPVFVRFAPGVGTRRHVGIVGP